MEALWCFFLKREREREGGRLFSCVRGCGVQLLPRRSSRAVSSAIFLFAASSSASVAAAPALANSSGFLAWPLARSTLRQREAKVSALMDSFQLQSSGEAVTKSTTLALPCGCSASWRSNVSLELRYGMNFPPLLLPPPPPPEPEPDPGEPEPSEAPGSSLLRPSVVAEVPLPASAPTTSPSALRDLLMAVASVSCAPCTLLTLVRSQPARSTIWSLASVKFPLVASVVTIRSVTTRWDLDEWSFTSVDAVARFSAAMLKISRVVAASGTWSAMAPGTETPVAELTRRSTLGGPFLGSGSTKRSRIVSL
mmetsp:Transcript_52155/g.118911  ORF Transcript_52155/g.118911 Transcript_52155/m.118911 type:complete len:309 (-) Transcript_52155:502-1428(-)